MLLLGVLQAQASGAVSAGSYDLLETEILASNQASVTFSSLSSYAADYQHLQIRMVARSSNSFVNERLNIRLNGISTTSYASHTVLGNGSSVVSGGEANVAAIYESYVAGGTAPANAFGASVIDILDPFETTKNTTLRILYGNTALVGLASGFLNNTAAVDSVSLFVGNFSTGSRFSLYGIRSA